MTYRGGVTTPSHALRLRHAKLSFPAVHLMVGVLSDLLCAQHGEPAHVPHIERCELVRHCRWVDEVVPEAPWRLDEVFIRARRIDYVAIDEGVSVNPAYEKERVRGYDTVKRLSKTRVELFGEFTLRLICDADRAILTKPTLGLVPSVPSAPATPNLRNSSRDILGGKGTIKGVSPLQEEIKPVAIVDPEANDNPFEEPLVNLFE